MTFFKPFAIATLSLSVLLAGCTDEKTPVTEAPKTAEPAQHAQHPTSEKTNPLTELLVYKSPTCGCCGEWITHAEKAGFAAKAIHPEDLQAEKQRWGVRPQYASCHTAVSKEGYVFEGHVPARLVQQFLAEKPAGAIGLAVPGMPAGSPGMEMGDQFTPYDVLLLKEDGSYSRYAHIGTQQEQY